jgi:hypothetical protein
MGGNAGGMGMMPGSGMAQMGGGGGHGMLHTAFLPRSLLWSLWSLDVNLLPYGLRFLRIESAPVTREEATASLVPHQQDRKQRSVENIV